MASTVVLALPGAGHVRAAGSITLYVYNDSPLPSYSITQGIGFLAYLSAQSIRDSTGTLVPDGTPIAFQIDTGPSGGARWAKNTYSTNADTSYSSSATGTDEIYAWFTDNTDTYISSNTVTVNWIDHSAIRSCVYFSGSCIYGVTLSATGLGGQEVTVGSTEIDTDGNAVVDGTTVAMDVFSGPDAGLHKTVGFSTIRASFYFVDKTPGVDSLTVSFTDHAGHRHTSPVMTVTWTGNQQTITFAQPPSGQVGGSNVPLSATASSGLAVSFSSGSPSICTLSGASAVPVAPGTCSITAHQAGNPSYFAAPDVTRAFTIAPKPSAAPGNSPAPATSPNSTSSPARTPASSGRPVGASSSSAPLTVPLESSALTSSPTGPDASVPMTAPESTATAPISPSSAPGPGDVPWLAIVAVIVILIVGTNLALWQILRSRRPRSS